MKKNQYRFSILDREKAKDKSNTVKRHLFDEPMWKKTLKGKLLRLLKNNLLLCERKFNPLVRTSLFNIQQFTESIVPRIAKQNVNKFKPLDDRVKVNIFTNTNPQVLQPGLHFYSRFFDVFQSPDELLANNFTEEEIYAIMSDPFYFKFSSKDFGNVTFFKKKSLTDTLNDEEQFGKKKVIQHELNESLKKTKKKIERYLDYYTYVMSQKDIIQDRYTLIKRKEKNKKNNFEEETE